MGMKQTIEILNEMVSDNIIGHYAICGAIAAYNYIEMSSTDDLDILVSFENELQTSGLVMLAPIFCYLAKKGYAEFRKEGLVIEGWPVQFLPVAKPLDAEALTNAVAIEINPVEGNVPTRVLTAEHVMATALDAGRPKDLIRINQFLEAGAFDAGVLCGILERHDLQAKWTAFCKRFEISDPCKRTRTP